MDNTSRAISADHYCLWPRTKRGGFPCLNLLGQGGTITVDGKVINVVKMTGAEGYKGRDAADKAAIFQVFNREVTITVGGAAPAPTAQASLIEKLQGLTVEDLQALLQQVQKAKVQEEVQEPVQEEVEVDL